jgi:hypothetical protein
MFYWTQEIDNISFDIIKFKDWTSIELNVDEQSYLLTEEISDEWSLDKKVELKMIEEVFNVIRNSNIITSFNEQEWIRDQNNVNIIAEIIKVMIKFNFKVSKIQYVFAYLKGFIWQIESLTNNNIKTIEDDIVVKALGIENLWKTNNERLYNITLKNYANFINNK